MSFGIYLLRAFTLI